MKRSHPRLPLPLETIYLLGALLLVLTIAVFSLQGWLAYEDRSRQQLISQTVRRNTYALLASVIDAETGQRGYLLTGLERYLEPYQRALQDVPVDLERLSQAVKERPDQLARLVKLRPIVAAKLESLRQTIELRRAGDNQAALGLVASDRGQTMMDELRQIADEMDTVSSARLAQQAAEAQTSLSRLTIVSTLGSLGIFGLLLLATATIHREKRRRQELLAIVKAGEQETRRVRDWLQTTLSSIGDGVIATDEQGRITFLNGVAQKLTGWTQELAAGVPLEEVFVISSAETGRATQNPAQHALRENRAVSFAERTLLRARDGVKIPIEDSAAPIRDEQGAVSGAVLVFRDATLRQEAELALELGKKHFQVMADNAPVLVWIADTERSWTWLNKHWLDFAGRGLEEELAHDLTSYVHPEELDEWLTVRQNAFANRQPLSIEYRRRRADGQYRWLLENGAPLHDLRGEFTGFIGSCTDITDQKTVEKRLVRLNEDLNQFAFAANHDLQEPLRMVSSFSELLINGFRGELPDEAELYVGFITEGTRRMRDLLADLLAYTQLEQDENAGQPVDLNAIFISTLANMQSAVAESKAMVTSDSLPFVHGQAAHFAQLFQNLISNAIKYRGAAPPVVHISVARGTGWPDTWEFCVGDNGMGIKEEFRQTIFGVFKRLHGKEIPGTGIGLAICQRVVERYGGKIWVNSAADGGSQFRFRLPVWKAAP